MSLCELAATASGKTVIAAGPLYSHRVLRVAMASDASDKPLQLQQAAEMVVAGGAGRLAQMLQSWGATVEVAGCIGTDQVGKDLSKILQNQSIATRCLVESSQLQTPTATDLFCGSDFFEAQHLTHSDFEPVHAPEAVLLQLRAVVRDCADGVDMAVTLASHRPDPVVETVCEATREAGVQRVELSPVEVDRLPLQRPEPDAKPRSLAELEWTVQQVRHFGGNICFTNGCFDLLHAGHVKYLQQAAACADRFILALNSDDSIRTIKGAGRPVLQQRDRLEVLAGLECVDYITIFDSEDVIPLLEVLRPEVYVKGGDYTIDTINQVERRFLEGYGAQIVLLPGVEGASTSEILRRIHDDDVR